MWKIAKKTENNFCIFLSTNTPKGYICPISNFFKKSAQKYQKYISFRANYFSQFAMKYPVHYMKQWNEIYVIK